MARKKPTIDEWRELCATMTAQQIAEKFSTSLGRVSNWGAEHNIKPLRGAWGGSRTRSVTNQRREVDVGFWRMKEPRTRVFQVSKRPPDEDIVRLAPLHSSAELATMWGVSQKCAAGYCASMGLRAKRPGVKKPTREAWEDLCSRYTGSEIAKIIPCSNFTVWKYAKDYAIYPQTVYSRARDEAQEPPNPAFFWLTQRIGKPHGGSGWYNVSGIEMLRGLS